MQLEHIQLEFHYLPKIQQFGHCSVILSKNEKYILNIGGFGQLENGIHNRLKNIKCFKVQQSNKFEEVKVISSYNFDFIHHSCNVFYESEDEMKIILFGGRKSPLVCDNIPKLIYCKFLEDNLIVEVDNLNFIDKTYSSLDIDLPKPMPRWRHSCSLIENVKFGKVLLIFGGCSQNLKASLIVLFV